MSDEIKALVERVHKWRLNGNGSWVNTPLRELRAAVSTITAQAEEIERLRGIVRLFTGAAYPVAPEINERGHNWSEAYLDQALKTAQEVKA